MDFRRSQAVLEFCRLLKENEERSNASRTSLFVRHASDEPEELSISEHSFAILRMQPPHHRGVPPVNRNGNYFTA